MKTKYIPLLMTVAFLASSCSTQEYVSWKNVPVVTSKDNYFNQRGALLWDSELHFTKALKGELLTVSNDSIYYQSPEGKILSEYRFLTDQWYLHPHRPTITSLGYLPFSSAWIPFHGDMSWRAGVVKMVIGVSFSFADRHAYKIPMSMMNEHHLRAYCRFPVGIPETFEPVARPNQRESLDE